MTTATGDALSHGLWRRRLKALCQAFGATKSFASSRAKSRSATRVTVTHHGHRSTLKRMAGMSSHGERRAPASHSIIALLTENSASSPMTSFISIHKY
jgi:hypothetical protein